MKRSSKATIMTVVSLLTFAFGVSPAMADSPVSFDTADTASAQASYQQQNLVTTDSALSNEKLDPFAVGATTEDGVTSSNGFALTNPPAGYDVDAAIAAARSEIGTSRPTGWDQPGECISSVRRWVLAGGGQWTGSGTPVQNYRGASRVALSDVQPGDVLQYENATYPDQWVSGVHTMLVTGVNPDGTLQIIESNLKGAGLVTENRHFTPAPPQGFITAAWRF